MLVLPTPGHTPGSVSLLVRRPGHAPLLMVGDLTYDDALLAAGKLPGVGDKQQMRQSVHMVNALRRTLPGLVVLPATTRRRTRLDAAVQAHSVREAETYE